MAYDLLLRTFKGCDFPIDFTYKLIWISLEGNLSSNIFFFVYGKVFLGKNQGVDLKVAGVVYR